MSTTPDWEILPSSLRGVVGLVEGSDGGSRFSLGLALHSYGIGMKMLCRDWESYLFLVRTLNITASSLLVSWMDAYLIDGFDLIRKDDFEEVA